MNLLSDQELENIARGYFEIYREEHKDYRAIPDYSIPDFVNELELEIIKKVKKLSEVWR